MLWFRLPRSLVDRGLLAVPESTMNSYKTLLEDKCEDICLKPNMQRKYQWGNNPQLRSKSTKDVLKKEEETQGGLVKESQ